jgi:hypothetical protein
MAKKRKNKSKVRARVQEKKEPVKRWRLPEVLGWETFLVLLAPSVVGVWYAMRSQFDADASFLGKAICSVALGTMACGLLTWVANAVWRRMMGVR